MPTAKIGGTDTRSVTRRGNMPLLQLAVIPAAGGDNLKPKHKLSRGQARKPRANRNDSTQNNTAAAGASRPRRSNN